MDGTFCFGYLKMGKRVFIAMPAGEVLRGNALAFRASHSSLPVCWIPPENLHVTLVPPWYCEDTGEVCKELHDLLADVKPFDVCFNEISAGPTARKPRLIWASGGIHTVLGELRGRLSSLAGPESDNNERNFFLHVTFARIRKGQKVNLSPEAIDWKATLNSVCFYESILHPSGAEYRMLCEVELSVG